MTLRVALAFAAVSPLAAWGLLFASPPTPAHKAAVSAVPPSPDQAYLKKYCTGCHDTESKQGGLDLTALAFSPTDADNFRRWVKVYDRVQAGEMPPKDSAKPAASSQTAFLTGLSASLSVPEREAERREGRATQRRLNNYEYENALRDLFQAPYLQVRGQFPDDGEAYRFNKVGDSLDVSHVHLARYMLAADYAIRQAMSVQYAHPPTTVRRFYARDQKTLTKTFSQSIFNTSPDRQTYPVLGSTAQPEIRRGQAPVTVGNSDPKTRELEAVGWVSSNYVTGFTYRWDGFHAPTAGRYRVRFSGYTLWAAPGGNQRRFAGEQDKTGTPGKANMAVPNYDEISSGRTTEPITVYTRNGIENRRVGSFDLTPEPKTYDIGEIWLLAGETLVPDASRFYRSRPPGFRNPLMTKDGTPSVAFRWMEVEGPLYDDSSTAGYRLLFGDLPMKPVAKGQPGVVLPVIGAENPGGGGKGRGKGKNSGGKEPVGGNEVIVDVVSANPKQDADRLMRAFLKRAYRRPVGEADVQRFLGLVENRRQAGLSFAESMVAGYTAALASPTFVFLNEKPGLLDDTALATRLALFLWNSVPDDKLRAHAAKGELRQPAVLRAETERLLNDPKSARFREAFLDYWLDLRKMEDSTPSVDLYNDYYLDDALTEASQAESEMYFDAMVRDNLPAHDVVDADFTFLNERLAQHYGIPGVKGIAMRRVTLPPNSPRGGFLTQASVLKVTANGTTTSPVLRGKWIMERILGQDVPPPPPTVPAVEPDIRGAVTIRQQLDKHRADPTCASCHRKIDPAGFALESFDVMGAWRDRYRAVAEDQPAVAGIGKNGHTYVFHYALPVDCSGTLPDGRNFASVRDYKKLLKGDETTLARNLARQLAVYATGAPIRFCDRAQIEQIVQNAKPTDYGTRTLIHNLIQSDLFRNK